MLPRVTQLLAHFYGRFCEAKFKMLTFSMSQTVSSTAGSRKFGRDGKQSHVQRSNKDTVALSSKRGHDALATSDTG
jgi:hypothetical protein